MLNNPRLTPNKPWWLNPMQKSEKAGLKWLEGRDPPNAHINYGNSHIGLSELECHGKKET